MTSVIPSLDVLALARFEPRREWFQRRPIGIHGIEHETRVLVLVQLLARMEAAAGSRLDAEALGWAAVVHDTQRLDDDEDPEHGNRAAEWIRARPALLPAPVSVDRVAYLCRWHVPADSRAPLLSADLCVFKDADGLDRWRIGDLDPTCFRTQSSRALHDFSHRLWKETEGLGVRPDAFHRVLAVAERLSKETAPSPRAARRRG